MKPLKSKIRISKKVFVTVLQELRIKFLEEKQLYSATAFALELKRLVKQLTGKVIDPDHNHYLVDKFIVKVSENAGYTFKVVEDGNFAKKVSATYTEVL